MRAVVCQDTSLRVAEVPDPVPGAGQVLLEVERCGICGWTCTCATTPTWSRI